MSQGLAVVLPLLACGLGQEPGTAAATSDALTTTCHNARASAQQSGNTCTTWCNTFNGWSYYRTNIRSTYCAQNGYLHRVCSANGNTAVANCQYN